jgi:hypothetical protein
MRATRSAAPSALSHSAATSASTAARSGKYAAPPIADISQTTWQHVALQHAFQRWQSN